MEKPTTEKKQAQEAGLEGTPKSDGIVDIDPERARKLVELLNKAEQCLREPGFFRAAQRAVQKDHTQLEKKPPKE